MIIIIAGVSRSGKSTVAKRLVSLTNFNLIPFDSIITTLENLYPEIGIRHFDDNATFSPKLAEFTAVFISHLQYEELDGIIDIYQLFPADYVTHIVDSGAQIIYLGYPDLSAEEKLKYIRKYQRKIDWTTDMKDEEMLAIISKFIHESKIMQEQCRDHNIPFFDTAENFNGNIDKAVKYLVEIIENKSI